VFEELNNKYRNNLKSNKDILEKAKTDLDKAKNIKPNNPNDPKDPEADKE